MTKTLSMYGSIGVVDVIRIGKDNHHNIVRWLDSHGFNGFVADNKGELRIVIESLGDIIELTTNVDGFIVICEYTNQIFTFSSDHFFEWAMITEEDILVSATYHAIINLVEKAREDTTEGF